MLLLKHFTKQCTKCNELKLFSAFCTRNASKDKLNTICKICCKIYNNDNKEKIALLKKNWGQINKESIQVKVKEWRNMNREKLNNYSKIYNSNNKIKVAIYQKKYFKTDIGKASSKNQRHKQRSSKKQGDITASCLLSIQQNAKTCYWCGISLKKVKVHIDHYIPISKGGEHTLSNLVVSCAKCNQNKSAKDPIIFANLIGRLL